MIAIRVRNLKKTFGAKTVLDSVSMTVHEGDICGFLGPNGSGKTTTLRVLLGIMGADEGEVSVLGLNPALSGHILRRRVNALPESHGLYGWMSAHRYLKFFSQLYGMTPNTDQLRTGLLQVGLDPNDHRPIRTFSRGMKQRLGIARATINEASILFLDEPTNGLDPRGRREIHDLLLTLNREQGLTIVISTHILDDVERLCNRIAIMDMGRVRYEGPLASGNNARSLRYRLHLDNSCSMPSGWTYPGIDIIENKEGWITCSIDGIPPAYAIKTLVEAGLPILEAEILSGGLEDLYLSHTEGGVS